MERDKGRNLTESLQSQPASHPHSSKLEHVSIKAVNSLLPACTHARPAKWLQQNNFTATDLSEGCSPLLGLANFLRRNNEAVIVKHALLEGKQIGRIRPF